MTLASSAFGAAAFASSAGDVQPPEFDASKYVRAQIVTRSVTGPVIVDASVRIIVSDASGAEYGVAAAFNDAQELIDPDGVYGDPKYLTSDANGQAAFWVESGIYNIEVTKDETTSRWVGYRVGQSQSRAVGIQGSALPEAGKVSSVIGGFPAASDSPDATAFVVKQDGEWRVATLAQMKQWINV